MIAMDRVQQASLSEERQVPEEAPAPRAWTDGGHGAMKLMLAPNLH